MYYIDLKVEGQKITVTNQPDVITYSKNKICARFTFTEEWQNQTNTAIFTSRGKKYKQLITNNQCLVPVEVLDYFRFNVGVFGGSLNTTINAEVFLKPSCYGESTDAEVPTQNIYEQIISKIDSLQAGTVTDEQIATAVDKYLTENPVQAGITETEMKTYVDTAIAAIDLSGYATATHTHTEYASVNHTHAYSDITGTPTIPTKVSDLTNDSNYQTAEQVSTAIANASLSGGDVDLSGYVTTTAMNTALSNKADSTHTHSYNDLTDKPTITNGVDGQDGTDGVSPTVTSSKVDGVTTLSITDATHTEVITINDGEDGTGGSTTSTIGELIYDFTATEEVAEWVITQSQSGVNLDQYKSIQLYSKAVILSTETGNQNLDINFKHKDSNKVVAISAGYGRGANGNYVCTYLDNVDMLKYGDYNQKCVHYTGATNGYGCSNNTGSFTFPTDSTSNVGIRIQNLGIGSRIIIYGDR